MSRVYRSRMAGVQNNARRRQAGLNESMLGDPGRCRKNFLTRQEKQDYKIQAAADRAEEGLVDGLRAESVEVFHDYMEKRERESAGLRPDRRREPEKKRGALRPGNGEVKEKLDMEKVRAYVDGLSVEKARRVRDTMKRKYGGRDWPKDVRIMWMMIREKAEVKVYRGEE